ncbi:MAG TPA: ATP-binding protein, partial [Gammaproteobacteria bacterium]
HDGGPTLASHLRQRLRQSTTDGPLNGGYQLRFGTPREIRGQVYLQTSELDAAKLELVRLLCDLAAVTLERTRLVADLEQARQVSETEQLRSALLASVSHDLRTPLSSIIGASSSLIEFGDTLPRIDCKELLQTVLSEAERLNRYIQNLLDMTRLSGGTLTPQRDWVDIGDIIATAVERLQRELAPFRIELSVPAQLPLLSIQGVLIEQALVNVLDNAARFSPPGAPITLSVEDDGNSINIDVCDQGPGIPASDRERVFDMFYTASRGDRKSQGTGLGLAICRGLLNAHGGQASAHPGRDGSGTCIRMSLPHHNTEHEE